MHSRGIPSYTENSKDFIFGTDLLASEYRAIQSFQQIASTHADRKLAQQMEPAAQAIQELLERVAWSKTQHHYFGTIRRDLSGSGSGDALVLYFRASKDPAHLHGALDYVASPKYWEHINIEQETYLPLTLFRYGRAGAAYQILRDLSSPQKDRREYPEVSYAVIAALVGGVMGLEPSHADEPFNVRTLSLLSATDRATLSGVAIGRNHLEITHIGQSQTRMKNNAGPALRWRAAFIARVDHLRGPALSRINARCSGGLRPGEQQDPLSHRTGAKDTVVATQYYSPYPCQWLRVAAEITSTSDRWKISLWCKWVFCRKPL